MVYVGIAAQFLIGLVFAAAALSKVWGPSAFDGFSRAVQETTGVTGRSARVGAGMVVAGELITAAAVVVPVTALAGFVLGALLLVMFTAAALAGPSVAACRCFGASAVLPRRHQVWRNAALLSVCVLGAAVSEGSSGGGTNAPGLALAAVAAAVMALAVVRLEDLINLFTSTASR